MTTKTKKKAVIDYKALYLSEQRESAYNKDRWGEAASKLRVVEEALKKCENEKWDAIHKETEVKNALQKIKYDVIRWLINPATVPHDDGEMGFGNLVIKSHIPRRP